MQQAEVIRVRAQLLVTLRSDPEIVFEAQTTPAGPVNSGLDGQYHALANRSRARLMGIGRLVGARSYTVAYRMRGLTRIASLTNASPNKSIEVREARSILRKSRCFLENAQQEIEQAVIFARKRARTKIFRRGQSSITSTQTQISNKVGSCSCTEATAGRR